jgi:hypothetical protein
MDSSADCIGLGMTRSELLLQTRIDSFNPWIVKTEKPCNAGLCCGADGARTRDLLRDRQAL